MLLQIRVCNKLTRGYEYNKTCVNFIVTVKTRWSLGLILAYYLGDQGFKTSANIPFFFYRAGCMILFALYIVGSRGASQLGGAFQGTLQGIRLISYSLTKLPSWYNKNTCLMLMKPTRPRCPTVRVYHIINSNSILHSCILWRTAQNHSRNLSPIENSIGEGEI